MDNSKFVLVGSDKGEGFLKHASMLQHKQIGCYNWGLTTVVIKEALQEILRVLEYAVQENEGRARDEPLTRA